jgi:succinate dehydrogenase/fumarate reductase flavoprotein subunit
MEVKEMSHINPKWGSWALPPVPIPKEDIKTELNADVVVVGAGISGITCALKAAQGGAKVIVVEKASGWSARGGNIGVASSSFMKARGYENDIEQLGREWIKRNGNRCDEKLMWLYLKKGGEVMDWLTEILAGPDYMASPELQGCLYKGETYREYPGSHRFFGGPMAKKGQRAGAADAFYAMYCEALKLGVQFLFRTPAEQLVKENGRVTGVIARNADGYIHINAEHGVVLATGDIGGNKEMCEDLAPLANRCASNVYSPRGGNMGRSQDGALGRRFL